MGRLLGDTGDGRFGTSLARVGDLDGDGRDDWLIGAPGASGQGYARAVSSASFAKLYTLEGFGADGDFGFSATRITDLDGDGTDDLAVGDPERRRVHLHSGRTGESLLTLLGPPNSRFGNDLCATGDVDRDGRADWVVGAPANGYGSGRPGSIHLLSGADAHRIASLDGPNNGEQFGYRLACVGDLDGDGIDEILVTSEEREDVSLVSLGQWAVLKRWSWNAVHQERDIAVSAGDIDGDGRDELVMGVPFVIDWTDDGGIAHVITTPSPGEYTDDPIEGQWTSMSFGSAVQVLGDLDGDGRAELAVGAPEEHMSAPFGGVLRIHRR